MKTEQVTISAPIALFPEHFDEWLKEASASEDTRDTYERGRDLFLAWADDLAEVTPAVFRQWRDDIQGAPATVNLYLSIIRSFLGWCADQGYISISPAAGVKGIKRPGSNKTHQRDELTADEVTSIMSSCAGAPTEARDRAIIALMAYTGLRTIEAHRADTADLRTRGGRRVLWVQGKGHKSKDEFVVIPAKANPHLNRWLAERPIDIESDALFISLSNRSKGQRLSRSAIRRLVKKYFKLANVIDKRKTTHSLRHSAITFAIRGGGDLFQVQEFARHADPKTTLKYYHGVDRTQKPAEDLIHYD